LHVAGKIEIADEQPQRLIVVEMLFSSFSEMHAQFVYHLFLKPALALIAASLDVTETVYVVPLDFNIGRPRGAGQQGQRCAGNKHALDSHGQLLVGRLMKLQALRITCYFCSRLRKSKSVRFSKN